MWSVVPIAFGKFNFFVAHDQRIARITTYKGQRFNTDSVLDMRTHFKPTETFKNTFFTTSHPPGAKKGFVKCEALNIRLLRTTLYTKIWFYQTS